MNTLQLHTSGFNQRVHEGDPKGRTLGHVRDAETKGASVQAERIVEGSYLTHGARRGLDKGKHKK